MQDITIALSKRTIRNIFENIRDDCSFHTQGDEELLLYTFAWDIGVYLANGSLEFPSGDAFKIDELDIVLDPFILRFGIDLPSRNIGGQCIAPTPFGCALRLPSWTVFNDNPDVSLSLDLSGLLRSEISCPADILIRRWRNPERPPRISDHRAHAQGVSNRWQVFLNVHDVDPNLIDMADIVADKLEEAIDQAVDRLLGPLPGWVKDIITLLFGPVTAMIRRILDIPDDVEEWFTANVWYAIDIPGLITEVLINHFAHDHPLYEFEDPYPIMEGSEDIMAVLLPIEEPKVMSNERKEVVLTARIGG